MAAASFSSLVTLPHIISGNGLYTTRCGETISVTITSNKNNFGCHGQYESGQTDRWHRSGRLYFGVLSDNDIVSTKM